MSASDLLDLVLDSGSFESWDQHIDISGHTADYQDLLRRARSAAGTDESVVTGCGTVSGRSVAVLLNEFRFMAGSIGQAAAARIVSAIRRATAEGLPLLASTASGGTRMHEGTPAFLAMIDITRAVVAHRAAGLPYLVHHRHPTTGGVYASWGSLGHITIAEPGALIGFLGPKVSEALLGSPFPADTQVAENLACRGVIDAVVPNEELRELIARTLGVLMDPPTPPRSRGREVGISANPSAWSAVAATRRDDRVRAGDVLRFGGGESVRLSGTGDGDRDDAVLLAITRFDGQPCVVIGQDRRGQPPRAVGPEGLRQARRAMALAEELGLPLVTLVDTPGAEISPHAEDRAVAGEIARCLAMLSSMSVPTVSVLLGQGAGGGALALLATRRRVALENAWLAPLPPEGASVIVHGDMDHAAQLATSQRIRAVDLHHCGAVQTVIAERPDQSRRDLAETVAAVVSQELRGQDPCRSAARPEGDRPSLVTLAPGR